MGENPLIHISIPYKTLMKLLIEYADDYAWISDAWTIEREIEVTENFINKLVDID